MEQKMTTKRRKHTAKLKFKVALEAAKNDKTRSQIASEFEVHPTQVSQWKNELLSNGSTLFETTRLRRVARERDDREVELYEQIGRLKMELEWLKKKSGQVG
jgi:putative transposase